MGPTSSHINCEHSVVRTDIKKHGYEWTDLISDSPSLSLARHMKSKFTVAILQYHRAKLDHNGVLDYWKCIVSDYCLQLYESFAEGKYHYFVTNAIILGNVRAFVAKDDSRDSISQEKFILEATFHVLKAFQDIHKAGFAHLNFDWSHVWIDIHHQFYLGGFENLIPINKFSEAIFGLQAYRPPEVLQNALPTSEDHLQAADMWALGACIVEILTSEWIGFQDFQERVNEIGSTKFLRYINDNMEKLQTRLMGHCPNNKLVYSFVQALLVYDPLSRLTVDDALGHAWITSRDVNNVSFSPKGAKGRKSGGKAFKISSNDQGQLTSTDKSLVSAEDIPKMKEPYTAYKIGKFGYRYIKLIDIPSKKRSNIIQAECTVGTGLPLVAIKIKHRQLCLRGERFHWQIFNNDNVLKLIDTFQDGRFVFFVTEFMANQDVLTYLRNNELQEPYDTKECFMHHVTEQVLKGFHYIHNLGMAHLKFSMRHVLLDSNLNVRLSGFSHLRSEHGQWHLCFGSLPNRPPETLAAPGILRYNISKVDMWSLGASLMRILNKKNIAGVAFSERNEYHDARQVYQNILDNLLVLPEVLGKGKLNGNLQEFLLNLLHYRPETRMSADEALHHAWIVAKDLNSKSKPKILHNAWSKKSITTRKSPPKASGRVYDSRRSKEKLKTSKDSDWKNKPKKKGDDMAKKEAKLDRDLINMAGRASYFAGEI